MDYATIQGEALEARKNVKVGDKWQRKQRFSQPIDVTVVRLTPKQIVFSDTGRVDRDTGRTIGNTTGRSFNRKYYEPVTPAIIAGRERDMVEAAAKTELLNTIGFLQAKQHLLTADLKVRLAGVIRDFLAERDITESRD